MAESIRRRLARLVNLALKPTGLRVVPQQRLFDMDGLIARAASHDHRINTWVDVGASDGSWSMQALRHFPNASFLLFEPLAERQPALAACARRHDFKIVAAAAGASAGQVEFAVDPNLDGSSIASPGATHTRRVRVETIASAVATHAVKGPYGIKLDTHGFEIPILEGADPILGQTQLLVIEAYNFKLTDTSVRFHELCGWLEARGFRCCDLADPMRRPSDGALWQMDLAFARANHPTFTSNRYV
jgi:FkbM family methyltransferase